MIKRATASVGWLSPECCLTMLLFSFTPQSCSTRWHIMEFLADFESFYCFFLSGFMHPLLVRAQCTKCFLLRDPFDIFALPLHYLNIQSSSHNLITVKSLLYIPVSHVLIFLFDTESGDEMRLTVGSRRKGENEQEEWTETWNEDWEIGWRSRNSKHASEENRE